MSSLYVYDARLPLSAPARDDLLAALPAARYRNYAELPQPSRDQMLIAYGLLRFGLARSGLSGRPVLVVGQFGKPDFANPLGLHFSVSHCMRYAACVVADVPVGVDVEIIRSIEPEAVQLACHPIEWAVLQSHPRRDSAFIRLWTCKESHGKRLGLGLEESVLGADFSTWLDSASFERDGVPFVTYAIEDAWVTVSGATPALTWVGLGEMLGLPVEQREESDVAAVRSIF